MNEFTKDSPTSEKLVAELGTKTDITICADIVHGLDYEYKQLQQKNQELKGQLELYENGVYYFSELDRKDKEIDKLNKQLGEWEQHLINAKEMLELQGHNGNYNYDSYMLGLYNGMEYIIALFETREPNFKNGKDIEFLNDKNKNQELKKQLEEKNKTKIFVEQNLEETYGEGLYLEHLEKENQQLKEKLNCDLKWAFKYDELYQENKKLKEQLQQENKELKNLNRIYEEIISDDEENYKLLSSEIKQLENQQKEFIEWLSYRIDYGTESISYRDSFREVLQKYKEIIGSEE